MGMPTNINRDARYPILSFPLDNKSYVAQNAKYRARAVGRCPSITPCMENITEKSKAIRQFAKKPALLSPFLIMELGQCVLYKNEIHRYNGKYYDLLDDETLGRFIYNFYLSNDILDAWNSSRDKEIKVALKYSPQLEVVDNFDNYDNLINLNSGILNLDTFSQYKHDPSYYFSYILDADYDASATSCPNFTRFVQGLFAFSGSFEHGYRRYDKKMVENVLRLGGYIMFPAPKIKSLFVFIGSGANGKSMLIDIYKMFFPKKFISALSLGTLASDTSFTRTPIITSRLNICTEAKGEKVDSEEIKKIVDGESITVQRKYSEPLTFNPSCKILMAANNMPYFNDQTHGTLRRLRIFDFRNRFVDAETFKQYKDDYKNRRIFKKAPEAYLWEKFNEEKPAILNKFLDALKRLKDDHWQFVGTQNLTEIMDEYKETSDTLGSWLEKTWRYNPNILTPVKDIYAHFRYYYEINFAGARFNYSTNTLGRKIREIFRIQPIYKYDWEPDIYGGKKFSRVAKYNLEMINIEDEAAFKSSQEYDRPTIETGTLGGPDQAGYTGSLFDGAEEVVEKPEA